MHLTMGNLHVKQLLRTTNVNSVVVYVATTFRNFCYIFKIVLLFALLSCKYSQVLDIFKNSYIFTPLTLFHKALEFYPCFLLYTRSICHCILNKVGHPWLRHQLHIVERSSTISFSFCAFHVLPQMTDYVISRLLNALFDSWHLCSS